MVTSRINIHYYETNSRVIENGSFDDNIHVSTCTIGDNNEDENGADANNKIRF